MIYEDIRLDLQVCIKNERPTSFGFAGTQYSCVDEPIPMRRHKCIMLENYHVLKFSTTYTANLAPSGGAPKIEISLAVRRFQRCIQYTASDRILRPILRLSGKILFMKGELCISGCLCKTPGFSFQNDDSVRELMPHKTGERICIFQP